MRKNLLIAALIGLFVVGVTACSRGEENKGTTDTTPSTAMAQPEAAQVVDPAQAPQQTADSSAVQAAPIQSEAAAQPEASPMVADANSSSTPDSQTSAPADSTNGSATDSSMPSSDNNGMTTAPSDNSSSTDNTQK